jgi:hypothetical protein
MPSAHLKLQWLAIIAPFTMALAPVASVGAGLI